MKKDKHITEVIFRKFKEGDIIAIFPYLIDNWITCSVMSYMHVGQHSGCDYDIVYKTKLATPEEYQYLKKELENIGYNLKVIKKMNYNKFHIKIRLEYLRHELRNECISYSELHELQNLVKYIDSNDVELLEAAGVKEF